jgi:hypothetical protein
LASRCFWPPGFSRSIAAVLATRDLSRKVLSATRFSRAARLPAMPCFREAPRRRGKASGAGLPFPAHADPVYVGGYSDNAYPAEPAPQQQQPQPNSTVVEPSQPAPAMIERFGSDDAQDPTTPVASADDDLQPMEEQASIAEPSHYLIAFKDHSVYSAVAYWVDGDTLHYFTSGNTHNQASVSLVDRDLTERLNKESGVEVRLPPVK